MKNLFYEYLVIVGLPSFLFSNFMNLMFPLTISKPLRISDTPHPIKNRLLNQNKMLEIINGLESMNECTVDPERSGGIVTYEITFTK